MFTTLTIIRKGGEKRCNQGLENRVKFSVDKQKTGGIKNET